MGERSRFEALYGAHAGAVLAYALRRTDAATADDVVSDVFLVAWRRIDELPDEPRPWLLGTARKIISNHRRSAARWTALHHRVGHERPADPAELATAVDEGVLLALAALSETDREALLLVGWDDLAPREAAAVLGIRPTNFTMRLSRARRRFASQLEAQGATSPTTVVRSCEEVPDAR